MNRSDLKRIPGRLAWNSISLYSKGGTTIDQELQYASEEVNVVGMGKVDNRDKEANYKITLTPDGRMSTAIASKLWPYNNPVIGSGIFTDTDVPAQIHGNDSSLDTYASVAVETMPQMIFHPVKTLVGQVTLLALRGHTSGAIDAWATTGSLLTEADTGGSFNDSTVPFATSDIITQNYTLNWGSITNWTALDFYDGLVFEPKIEYVDDNVAAHGLFNRRIKSVGGLLRGIPIGLARSEIQSKLNIQGIAGKSSPAVARGTSGAAKAAAVTVTGLDGKVYLSFPLGQLIKSKKQHGVEQLREGEVAWEALPVFDSGARGAYFTTPIAPAS
ncbi:MAG TPA: hypothetical protein VK815_07920 [Candidatus Acidoferrales bacterium]|jgi:hypothetical protein|nr:hypothetical protein [Candidatus Acidoferrales bacterium]